MKSKKFSLSKLVIVLLLLVPSATAVYYYQKNKEARKDPVVAQKKEIEDLVAKVKKLMLVPDETPTLATVEDKEKLKDQPFFKDAENGDKILIFTAAKKAIIYRPNDNRVINSGPIAVTSDTVASTVTVSVMASKSSSAQVSATKTALNSITGITLGDGTAKGDYEKTQVLDVSGNNSQKTDEIVAKLGAEKITKLPEGETVPDGSSIVVFVKQ